MSEKHYIAPLLVVLLFLPVSVSAQHMMGDLRDAMQFFLGAGTALLAHEAGHGIAGGNDVEWNDETWPGWHCVRPCNESRIAAAGFVSQITVSETLARAFHESEYRHFRNGMRFFNMAHLLGYAMRNDGDIDNFKPGDRRAVRVALVLFAAYSFMQIEF